MTSHPLIALVKRGPQLYISGIIRPRDGEPDSGLLRVMFIGQGLPHQAFLGRLAYGPVGEGDTVELAAQALVEKLQTETADFPAFLLALANGAEAEADGMEGAEEDVSSLEQDAVAFRILAGLAAQEHRDEQVLALRGALDESRYTAVHGLAAQFGCDGEAEISTQKLAEAMFAAGWRLTAPAASTTATP